MSRATCLPDRRAGRLPSVNFWVTSVAVPIGVAGATSVVAQLTFGPRLAARSAHLQALHTARVKLADDLLKVMLTCDFLEGTASNPRLASERARWETQLGELTLRLADDGPAVALHHLNRLGVPVLIIKCFALIRGVWISARPLPQRLADLKEIAGPVQQLYGRYWWHGPGNIARMRAVVAKYQPKPPA